MKKIYYTWIQRGLALLSCAALLLSCAKEGEHPWEDGRDLSHPIELSAGIGIESGTKGPVSGKAFPAGTDGVFFVTAYKGQSAPSDWSAAYFHEQVVNCDADGVLKFATPQYYPANGDKLYFYAYAPKASSITEGGAGAAPAVRYTIDGSQDIIAAQVTGGIAKATAGEQPQPAFAFLHKLKQIKFKVVKDEQFGEGVHLTSLKIVEASTAALLDLANGDLSWDGESTGDLTAYADDAGQEITDESLEVGTPVMMEPGTSFKVQVTAGGVTYNPVEVTLTDEGAGEAGMSHEVTLIFSLQSISYVAAIAEWTDGGSVGAGENDAYPYTIDGNTVVLRDQFGSADPTVYPLHEIWTETPEHEESVWNGTATGKNTYAERFEVARQDVGKMSHSGAKAACAAYSQASGVAGSWRLPTMRELKLIYDLRGGMTNVKAFTDNEVYWSATGTGENSAYLWSLNLKNGGLPDKSYPNESLLSVRCVRDLEQSFSLAYPYVQGGNTVVIKDRFGSADPVNYPTHQPWTITPEHSELAGDANASGYNIFAECFEVASQDIDPSPTSLNAAGACAAYSQASGAAGTWRVPTLQEMLLLTRLSKADELSAVEKIKVGGSSAVYYWTATKDANDNSRTWSVNTSTPHATSRDNNNPLPLRCVRDITSYENKAYPYVLEMQNEKSSDTYKLFVVRDYAGQLKNCALHEPWTETTLLVGRAGYGSYDKSEMPISNMMRPASRILGKYSLDEAIEKCHMYFENSDESDRGTWRIPTITEVKMLFGIFFPDIHMDLPDVVSENYDVYGSATYTSNSRSQICSLLVQRDSDILEGPMGQLVSMPCYFFCVKDYE